MKEDRRLTRLSKICMGLPEAVRLTSEGYSTFQVKKKKFAYFLNNHHNDGKIAVTCKVLPGDNTALVTSDCERFYLPPYVGSKGWVALRMDIGKIDWDEVRELVLGSYSLVAPKRLAALVDEELNPETRRSPIPGIA